MQSKLHVLYTDAVSLDRLRPILEELPQPSKHARIAIKPNLVVPKPSTSGATTDPALVECIIAYLREKGHEDIRIIEGSVIGESTQRAFQICGYESISHTYGVPLVDLKGDQAVRVSIHDLEIDVCREALDTDFLINLPVLKAHCQTRITCALKNLKGCIPDKEKRRFHALGLHKPIAALSHAIKTQWTIVDGIIGDLTFEEGGTPINMGRIIAGEDPVLIDTYVLQLLGYDLSDVPYVSMAADLGVGSTDLDNAEIIEHLSGDRPPVVAQPANPVAQKYVRYIDEREACSACYGSLIYALQRYEELHGALPQDLKLSIGQGFAHPMTSKATKSGTERNELGIGQCTAASCRNHVPGCPPTAKRILGGLVASLRSL